MKTLTFASLLVSFLVLPRTTLATFYSIYWDKNKATGAFDDSTMWKDVSGNPSPDLDKGAERFFRVESKNSGTNTVVLTDYNLIGALNLYTWGEGGLVLDGRGHVFGQQSPGEGVPVNQTVNYDAFTLRDNDYSMTGFTFASADKEYSSTISFSNSLQYISRSGVNGWFRWELVSGLFSFAEPDGVNAAHSFAMGSGSRYESWFEFIVRKDAEVTFPKLTCNCDNTNGLFLVDGGTLNLLGNTSIDGLSAAGWRDFVGTNDFIVRNGGTVNKLGGTMVIGANGNLGKRFDRITVDGAGSTLAVGASADSWDFLLSSELNVINGGRFEFLAKKSLNFGVATSGAGKDNPKLLVSGEGTTFDASGASQFYLSQHASAVFEDGADVKLPASVQFATYGANDDVSLTIRGADTVVTTTGNAAMYPGFSAGRAVMNLEGGRFGRLADSGYLMFRLSANKDGTGDLNISGGKFEIGSAGYDQFYLGFRGNSTVHVSGGELSLGCAMNFNYETTVTSERQSRFYMTGGTATVLGGVKMSGVNNAYRRSIVDLDGGILTTKFISADNSVTAGKLAPTDFSADGGTIVPTESRNAADSVFISNLDTFKLGPKGLTVDTKAFDTRILQAMTNKAGEDGLLVKKGSATLTLTGGAYDVALTRVEAGTLLLPDAEPDFSTALSVEQAGTFSLQGAATGVTLTGLAVNGGTLALDLGDVITVEGPVSLSALRLSFSALPEVDSDGMDFLVMDGELDDASKRALRRAIMDNVATEGAHVDVTADYDSGAGKTTIRVLHRTNAPVITDLVTWTGSGSWSTAENWDPAKPTGEKKAVFGDGGSATEVDVDEAAVAGAISFARDGYTLSGEGSIEIAGAQGAAQIEVTAGRQTVDVPIMLDAVTEVAVAGGASLTMAKPLTDGGIVKTGPGTAILTATNDFFKPVSLSGGVLELAGAATLGGAPRLDLAGNDTLVVSGEEPQRITVPVVANSTIGEPTILKTDCDVTFDSIAVSGALIKRGAGTATLNATQSPVASVLSSVKTAQTDAVPAEHAVTYFPADGSAPPSADWCGFTVAEGEFVVKGSAETPAVKIQNFLVGMNATNMDAEAQAKLTIDGAKVDASAAHCYVGYGTSRQYSRQYTPTLAILNGAFLNVNALHIGTKTYGGTDRHPTFLMTNSTIYVGWGLDISLVESADANRAITAAKGSEILLANPLRLQGRFDVDFDSCYIGGGNSAGARTAAPVTLHVNSYNQAQPGGTMRLRNGSILSAVFENFRYPTNPITFLWDDSEWRWANGLGTYTFTADSVNPDKTSFKMQGKGIILKPATGATFTTEVPFVGEGGVQNLGAGTVKFAAGTAQFTGAAYAAEGATVDFTEAGAFTAALSGPGTFRLASQNGLKLALTATDDWTVTEVPTLDATALTGILTVDFGRDADHPLSDTNPKGLVVAKLAPGTTYVPTALAKVRNTGLKNKRGVLSVNANGEIVMDVIDVGLMMIVR